MSSSCTITGALNAVDGIGSTLALNSNKIYFKAGTDANHWIGSVAASSNGINSTVDGPRMVGFAGVNFGATSGSACAFKIQNLQSRATTANAVEYDLANGDLFVLSSSRAVKTNIQPVSNSYTKE
jgi:hypothetical protein